MDNWSWYSFLAGFSHRVYCVGFNEANREYWAYVLLFLICTCYFVFMEIQNTASEEVL